jgi:enoyl-CoA hydratase/carnithine racemase
MVSLGEFTDLTAEVDGHVALLEIRRPPHNYFDMALIDAIASALETIDRETEVRAVVLAADGRSFCAGAQFAGPAREAAPPPTGNRRGRDNLYREAVRIFASETPIVAAVQGGAIGGGLGVALTADFRVATPETFFTANFARLGFHHGFGTTVTLPRIVGQQHAWRMLMTGCRVYGEEALQIGLADALVPLDDLRARAFEFAHEIAKSAPLAVRSIRRTLRHGLADEIRLATDREQVEQDWLRRTDDFREGVRATAERRDPEFHGR